MHSFIEQSDIVYVYSSIAAVAASVVDDLLFKCVERVSY